MYALRGVSLAIAPGEIVAVMGPSGCGKSTMLHLAGGLEEPSAGRVLVDGHDLGDMSRAEQAALRRREVGYVFQRLNLVPSLTAVENVMLPLELDGTGAQGCPSIGARRLAGRRPRRTTSTATPTTSPAASSSGSRSPGRSSVSARLLLADEPTGSLDTLNSDQIIEMLAELPDRYGTAVVLVTHEPRFASYADRIVFLRDGVIVDQSTREPSVTRRPRRRVVVNGAGAGGLAAWRFASRLARREVRRRPGRTVLVAVLVAPAGAGTRNVGGPVVSRRRRRRPAVRGRGR